MPNTEQSIEETGGVPEIELEVEVFGMVQTATDKSLTIPDMAADAKATGEAIANLAADVAALFDNLYPVGSVYITSAEELPTVIAEIGTWEEIAMPLRLTDIKNGSRTYIEPAESFTPGNLHMWMRTA
jgi:hypothetical protein